MGLSVGFSILGLFMILSAVVWAYFKTQEAVKLKDAIFRIKWRSTVLRTNPDPGNTNLPHYLCPQNDDVRLATGLLIVTFLPFQK